MTTSGQPHERPDDAPADLWLVVAVIPAFRLDVVILALEPLEGFAGVTVTDCCGFGRDKVGDDRKGGPAAERRVGNFIDTVRLEVVIAGRHRMNAVLDTIVRAAHTGNRGDGMAVAWPVSRFVRVRTFDEGPNGL